MSGKGWRLASRKKLGRLALVVVPPTAGLMLAYCLGWIIWDPSLKGALFLVAAPATRTAAA